MSRAEHPVNNVDKALENIRNNFSNAREHVYEWGENTAKVRASLGVIGMHLVNNAPIEQSYPGSDNRDVQRRTFWTVILNRACAAL